MKNVISLKDLETMVRNKQDLGKIPADAILTPSARDFLLERELESRGTRPVTAASNGNGKISAPAKPLNSKSSKSELETFFNSPYCQNLKEQICDIGRRLWQRAFVDGNGGNIAVRVGEDIAICTPTLVSKGFMICRKLFTSPLRTSSSNGGYARPRVSWSWMAARASAFEVNVVAPNGPIVPSTTPTIVYGWNTCNIRSVASGVIFPPAPSAMRQNCSGTHQTSVMAPGTLPVFCVSRVKSDRSTFFDEAFVSACVMIPQKNRKETAHR